MWSCSHMEWVMNSKQLHFFLAKATWASHQLSMICDAKAQTKRVSNSTIGRISDLNRVIDASTKAIFMAHYCENPVTQVRTVFNCAGCFWFERDSVDNTTQCLALPSRFSSSVDNMWSIPSWCPLCGNLSQHQDWQNLLRITNCPKPHKVSG